MNKVVHFEIPYDNASRAKKFYQDVFGWQVNDMPEMNYSMVMTTPADPNTMMPKEPGAINGGMMQRDPTSAAPVIVIDVESVDSHLAKIEKAGGKTVMPKIKVGDFGFYARVKDTEGNVIGIWQTTGKM